LHDHFAVKHDRVLRKRLQGRHDVAEPVAPVIATAGVKANAPVDMALEAIAIVFDLMNPLVAFRGPGGERCQRRLDKMRKTPALRTPKRAGEGKGRAVHPLYILAPGMGEVLTRHENPIDRFNARSRRVTRLLCQPLAGTR